MADEALTPQQINWREMFPFTHLFRAFRVAVHPSKLVIALLALACLWCGGLALDAVWPRARQVNAEELVSLRLPDRSETVGRLTAEREGLIPENGPDSNLGIFHVFFNYEVDQANGILMFRDRPFESVWRFVVVGPLWLWSTHWFFALIYTVWFLLIWSVFGGAIARIAAVHVARDEKISVRHALGFSAGKVLSFIFAPIIPVFIILGIGIAIALASTILLHIPYVGPVVAGLFFFLALLGGFVITLVLLGTIGGFNLMYPTVAVEGSDSFDAISRSFSYVFARPWRMLWYTLVAVVYGAICYLFVRFFVWLVLAVTWFFMNWFLSPGGAPAKYWPVMWPQPIDPLSTLTYSPDFQLLKGTESAAAGLIVWWVYLVIGLIGAFAISFYFSSNTIIYYLMRREVDATEFDDVYVEEADDELEGPEIAPPTGPGTGETVVVTETVVVATSPPASGENPPPPASTEGAPS